MALFPMVRREVQVAARLPRTYRARLVGAGIFVAQLAWMTGAGHWSGWFGPRDMFAGMAWTIFCLGLLTGIARTSDCISEELRENTLGLLFLTDLRGHDVVFGKLAARSIETLLMFLGLLPILSIPILLGGVAPDELLRVFLGLLNGLFFSLTAGVLASTMSRDSRQAVVRAAVLVFVFSLGTLALAELVSEYWKALVVAQWLRAFSVFSTLINAFEPGMPGIRARFWQGLVTMHLLSWVQLAIACWMVSRVWRDVPEAVSRATPGLRSRLRALPDRWRRWNLGSGQGLTGAERARRCLQWNPVYWRSARERVSGIAFYVAALIGVMGTTVVVSMLRTANPGPGGIHIFAGCWACLTVGLVLLFLARVAWVASHALAEDRSDGALEFLMATPLSTARIVGGQWLAIVRQVAGSFAITAAVCLVFFWAFTSILTDQPGRSSGEVARVIVRGILLRPAPPGWPDGDGVALNIVTALLPIALAHAIALSWVGIWHGVSVKHARNAPWFTLGLVLAPPWLLFAVIVQFVEVAPLLFHGANRQDGVWRVLIASHLGWAGMLTAWAMFRLGRWFRVLVTCRVEWEAIPWWWWLRPRIVTRVAGIAGGCALLVLAYYQLERWKGDRLWAEVEREAAARGERLSLESALPPPVPAELNMAAADFFKPLTEINPARYWAGAVGNPEWQRLRSVNLGGSPGYATGWWQGQGSLGNWAEGEMVDLAVWQRLYRQSGQFPRAPQPGDPARDVRLALTRFDADLRAVRAAAERPYARFPTAGQQQFGPSPHADVLWNISRLLNLRGVSVLRMGDAAAGLDDVLLIIALSEAMAEEPFWGSQHWRGVCLSQALQGVWEGLALGCWRADHLVVLQHRLESIDYLRIHRQVLRAEALREISYWDYLLTGSDASPRPTGWSPRQMAFLQHFYPGGWIQRKKVELYRRVPRPLTAGEDAQGRQGQAAEQGLAVDAASSGHRLLHQQSMVDLAVVACALERFRMVRGGYPAALEELVPDFLDSVPARIQDGSQLRYRRSPGGRFVLSSMGLDVVQPGAAPVLVWRYPVR